MANRKNLRVGALISTVREPPTKSCDLQTPPAREEIGEVELVLRWMRRSCQVECGDRKRDDRQTQEWIDKRPDPTVADAVSEKRKKGRDSIVGEMDQQTGGNCN